MAAGTVTLSRPGSIMIRVQGYPGLVKRIVEELGEQLDPHVLITGCEMSGLSPRGTSKIGGRRVQVDLTVDVPLHLRVLPDAPKGWVSWLCSKIEWPHRLAGSPNTSITTHIVSQ